MDASSRRQSDSAYEQLRQLVVEGTLKPGTLIEEASMMERLGVGRTPLREALQRLSQEELITNVPRRGYFVTTVSAADLFHVFEIRRNLEFLSARLAAERIDAAHLAALEELLAEGAAGIASDNRDLTWNVALDERFHHIVAQATGNPYLVSAIGRYYALSVRTLYLSRLPITLIKDEIANFRAVFEALKRHDGPAAEAAMREHLDFNPISLIPAVSQDRLHLPPRTDGTAAHGGPESRKRARRR